MSKQVNQFYSEAQYKSHTRFLLMLLEFWTWMQLLGQCWALKVYVSMLFLDFECRCVGVVSRIWMMFLGLMQGSSVLAWRRVLVLVLGLIQGVGAGFGLWMLVLVLVPGLVQVLVLVPGFECWWQCWFWAWWCWVSVRYLGCKVDGQWGIQAKNSWMSRTLTCTFVLSETWG